MALIYADRVKDTSTTTGTGTYTLSNSAPTGFQTFGSGVGNGNTCYYAATDGTDWEVGLGTYTSAGTTLARTTILASSNSNSAVNWSSGTRTLWGDYPASVMQALAPPISVAGGGTGLATLTAHNLLIGNGTSALNSLAPGSSGNVATSNGTDWTSAAPVSGGMTLLGTITATSGSTASLTGLTLTGYHLLYLDIKGVSDSANVPIRLALGSGGTPTYGTALTVGPGAGTAVWGGVYVTNLDSTAQKQQAFGSVGGTAISGTAGTGTAAVVNAVQFNLSSGTFNGTGTIDVYGVK